MRLTASQKYPEKYQELAGLGFRQAVKLYASTLGKEQDEAFTMLCIRLKRAEEQMRQYLRKGLPDNLVDSVLEVLKQHRIPFGKHQLKPTIAVIEITIAGEKRNKS
jgi:hypothetical protein